MGPRILAAAAFALVLASLALPWAALREGETTRELGVAEAAKAGATPALLLVALGAGLLGCSALCGAARVHAAGALVALVGLGSYFLLWFLPRAQLLAATGADVGLSLGAGPLIAGAGTALALPGLARARRRRGSDAGPSPALALLPLLAVAALTYLLAFGPLSGIEAPGVAPPEGEPSPPPPEPPGGFPALSPIQRGLVLDPGVPKLVRLTAEQLEAGPPRNLTLAATVDAEQSQGGVFGLLAEPPGEGRGFWGQGERVQGELSAPARSAEFVFYARAERFVVAWIKLAVWDRAMDERALATSERTASLDLTGRDAARTLDVEPEALLVELTRTGAGTVVLRDPGGRERARLEGAVGAWAFADAAGTWSVTCEGVCAGGVEVRVVAYRP